MSKPTLAQINLVSGDLDASIAFYRRLGVEIPESKVWRTSTGIHHVGAGEDAADRTVTLDLDSTAFAPHWNAGWRNQANLRGRVVLGFRIPTRGDVTPFTAT